MTFTPPSKRDTAPLKRAVLQSAGPVFCFLALIAWQCFAAAPALGAGVDMEWGGHLRVIDATTFIDDQSIYQYSDSGVYRDGQAELRLKNEIFIGSQWSLQTHYELVAAGGDTRTNNSALRRKLPGQIVAAYTTSAALNDDHRFFNLTRTLVAEDDFFIYHRLDRLNLTYTPSWGSLRIGRQALTWGNGMVFNPMDLFNPFAPTTVQRDYKVGDDMLLGQAYIGRHDVQLLYIPRRDGVSGGVRDSLSSYAAKFHLSLDAVEMNLMAARHYDDGILGWGATGNLGEAAWRLNLVYTDVSEDYRQDDFLQVVANLDYAWLWAGRNVYGLVEFFYNGLGHGRDYAQSLGSAYISNRLSRGDLFTLGRYYLAGLLQIELHPLVKNNWTVIVNLEDPSGLVQPQLLWDMTTNLQLILGAQWHWGASGTEYGGFDASAAGQSFKIIPSNQIYLWLTYHF